MNNSSDDSFREIDTLNQRDGYYKRTNYVDDRTRASYPNDRTRVNYTDDRTRASYPNGRTRVNYADDRTRPNQEKLDKMRRQSQRSCNEKYEVQKKQAKSSFISKAIIVAISTSVFLASIYGSVNYIQELNSRKNLINTNTSFMTAATSNSFDFEKQSYITIYDEKLIGDSILKYKGDIDLDTLIYMTYKEIDYSVIETLDKVFLHMNSIIEKNPEAYSIEVRKACQYTSFEKYLKAHGFEDTSSYKKTMQAILEAYPDYIESKKLEEMLVKIQIDETPNYGGR